MNAGVAARVTAVTAARSAPCAAAREEALAFACAGERLFGILHRPEAPRDVGVVVVVGGPQYRAGSHRQFVELARALADAGFAVLRFDVRGMGDSGGQPRGFEDLDDDIAAAIDALQRALPGVRRVALWGLCDGASAALLYLGRRRDARVRGVCVANPWVRSAASLARTHVKHYYGQRLLQREFWTKLLRGGIGLRAVRGLLGNVAAARGLGGDAAPRLAYPQRMAQAWRDFAGEILLMISGNDYTAKEFLDQVAAEPCWAGALQRPGVVRVDVDAADHTFSDPAHSRLVNERSLAWLQRLAAAPAPAAGADSGKRLTVS